jgi:dihydrofolate synthase/folylpolyglutamate synthase
VTRPCLSIITSIGLDHQQWLGTTTAAIAREKAGIMRPGCPVIWGGDSAGDSAAITTLRQEATRKQAYLWEQGQHFILNEDGLTFLLPGCKAANHPWPQLARQWPPFMRDNFAKACAALVWLLQSDATLKVRQRLGITDANTALADAIAAIDAGKVRVPSCMRGRFEVTSVPTHDHGPRRVLLDVCHNISGAEALVAGIRASGLLEQNKTLPGLVSILADKDCDEVLDILRQVLAPLTLFANTGERSWTQERLATRHRDLPFLASFAEAWTAAAPAMTQPTVICGSVHAVGEVTAALGIALD